MIAPAVTVSLVPEVRGGPFLFWDGIDDACAQAAALGFAGIELFLPGPGAVQPDQLRASLDRHGLRLAAVGTGAGAVVHGLTLTSADAAVRARARQFIAGIAELGGAFGAPTIVGSMQGRAGQESLDDGRARLADELAALAEQAHTAGGSLVLEPINRYETDLCNSLQDGQTVLQQAGTPHLGLLADLFHMNIEEQDIAGALRAVGATVRHLHFVDSNRRPAGSGHLDYRPVVAALADIGYRGWASAEALPYPDPRAAAQQTITTFATYFQRREDHSSNAGR